MLTYLWIKFQWLCEDMLALALKPFSWIVVQSFVPSLPWLTVPIVILFFPLLLLEDWVGNRICCRKYEILKRRLGVSEAEVLEQFPPKQSGKGEIWPARHSLFNAFYWLHWQERYQEVITTAQRKLAVESKTTP